MYDFTYKTILSYKIQDKKITIIAEFKQHNKDRKDAIE